MLEIQCDNKTNDDEYACRHKKSRSPPDGSLGMGDSTLHRWSKKDAIQTRDLKVINILDVTVSDLRFGEQGILFNNVIQIPASNMANDGGGTSGSVLVNVSE